jgi:hypothetical protein
MNVNGYAFIVLKKNMIVKHPVTEMIHGYKGERNIKNHQKRKTNLMTAYIFSRRRRNENMSKL